jgi:hypothetical protein
VEVVEQVLHGVSPFDFESLCRAQYAPSEKIGKRLGPDFPEFIFTVCQAKHLTEASTSP